jgi:hypothetical protein
MVMRRPGKGVYVGSIPTPVSPLGASAEFVSYATADSADTEFSLASTLSLFWLAVDELVLLDVDMPFSASPCNDKNSFQMPFLFAKVRYGERTPIKPGWQ